MTPRASQGLDCMTPGARFSPAARFEYDGVGPYVRTDRGAPAPSPREQASHAVAQSMRARMNAQGALHVAYAVMGAAVGLAVFMGGAALGIW